MDGQKPRTIVVDVSRQFLDTEWIYVKVDLLPGETEDAAAERVRKLVECHPPADWRNGDLGESEYSASVADWPASSADYSYTDLKTEDSGE